MYQYEPTEPTEPKEPKTRDHKPYTFRQSRNNLYGHDFFFLRGQVLVYKRNIAVGKILDVGFGIFGGILTKAVLLGFFDGFNGIAADVADGYLGMFSLHQASLHQFFSSFFGQGRKEKTDHASII